MLLTGSYLMGSLTRRQLDLEKDLQDLNKKLDDLHSYASNISNGVSIDSLTNCPPELFNRMCMLQVFSDRSAKQGAMMNMQQMMAMGALNPAMMQCQNPQQQMMYQQYVMNNLYQKQREKFVEAEKTRLNQEETKIAKLKEEKETELSMVKAEKQSVKQQVAEDAKESAPHFSGLG